MTNYVYYLCKTVGGAYTTKQIALPITDDITGAIEKVDKEMSDTNVFCKRISAKVYDRVEHALKWLNKVMLYGE